MSASTVRFCEEDRRATELIVQKATELCEEVAGCNVDDFVLKVVDAFDVDVIMNFIATSLSKDAEEAYHILWDEDDRRFASVKDIGKKYNVRLRLDPALVNLLVRFGVYPILLIHTHPTIPENLVFSPQDIRAFVLLKFPYAFLVYRDHRTLEIKGQIADLREALLRAWSSEEALRRFISEVDGARDKILKVLTTGNLAETKETAIALYAQLGVIVWDIDLAGSAAFRVLR